MERSLDPQKRRVNSALLHFLVGSRFGVQVMGTTLLFLATASYFIYQAFYQQYLHVMEIFEIVDVGIKQQLVVNDILVRNVTLLGLSILAYIAVMVLLIVRARHTYEGPLVSIEKFVADIDRGDYRHRIVIRKGDELKELVAALNQMAASLESRHPKPSNYDKIADL